jgi:hypothetical protein
LKQLRGFQRISLKPRETRTVEMPLAAEPGTQIVVGASSADDRQHTTVTVSR